MKLQSIKLSRSIWLLPLVDLNPRGLNEFSLIKSIIEKYKFVQVPSKPEEFDKNKGLKLGGGSFQLDTKQEISIELTVFTDGLVADSRSSTEDSDAFLDDFLTWISTEYFFINYKELIKSKIYLSELWVNTDKSLTILNSKLINFATRLNSLIVGHEHQPIEFEASGISFWTDPTIINPPSPFKFERAENTSFKENRYYSVAPLQTDKHLIILKELEDILSI
jgi:hypothetical protein